MNDETSMNDESDTGSTYKTDISETDDEGTTVRETEVRQDDMTGVDPSSKKEES
jgi:hypothetical protein